MYQLYLVFTIVISQEILYIRCIDQIYHLKTFLEYMRSIFIKLSNKQLDVIVR